jgi:pentatricopeptide repeat protein
MLSARLIFIALLSVHSTIASPLEVNVKAVNEELWNWFERADSKPTYMYEEGRRILEVGRLNVNCDSIVLGSVLMLRACNNEPGSFDCPNLEELDCELTGRLALEEIAFREFIEGRYDRAVSFYKQGLDCAEDVRSRVKLMQAIGTCFVQADLPDSAVHWYTASADFGLEYLTAINFSNISNAYLGAANPSESIVWSKQAEAKLIEEFQSGLTAETFAKRLDLILNNQVLAYVDLGELEQAERVFQRMSLEDFYPNMAAEFYHLALILSWAINDPYPVEMHSSAFERELILDSMGVVERFGPALVLIDPWRSAWEEGNSEELSAWPVLRGLPDEMLPELRQQSKSRPRDVAKKSLAPSMGQLLAMIWFALSLAFIVREWKLSASSPGDVDSNLAQMRAYLLYPESRTDREATRVFNGLKALASYPQIPSNLSIREVDVLMSMMRNERPKQTAARLEISTKSVYMIRSEIKKKIGLGANESLGDWLIQFGKPQRD